MNTGASPQCSVPLLEKVLQTAPDAIIVYQAIRDELNVIVDFRVVRCNEQAAKMRGFTIEQMTGETMLSLDPDGLHSSIFDAYRQVTETGLPTHIDHHFANTDVWMTQSLARYGDGVVGSWVDITDLKQAELANRQQANLLRPMLDSSSNAIVAFATVRDPLTNQITDFQYVAQNEVNRQFMHGTDETILEHCLLSFFPKIIDTGLFDRLVNVVESGEAIRFEQECMDNDRGGWYEISAVKWSDGIVLTLVNITLSKVREQEIERANHNLSNANENLQQFARVASHDLQEPLRKIISFGDLLQGQFAAELGDSGNDMIVRMQSAAHRMSELIRDVLTFSRVSTPCQPMQSVALNGIMDNVQAEFQNQYERAGMGVIVDSLPTVRCDREQIKQLVANLFSNALKFRSADQTAALHISYRTLAGTIYPNVLNPAVTYYEISFTDNGIGFDSKYASQIFQVFQRLHTRHQYAGTGVGLAICRRVVENHHGAITATAKPGEGATFRVYLPEEA